VRTETTKHLAATVVLAFVVMATVASPALAGSHGPRSLPTITINDLKTVEGNEGTHDVTFVVRLSGASTETITVAFDTYDISATEGVDYYGTSRTLTFDPGRHKVSVAIPIIGDTLQEGDEGFVAFLSTAINATIADSKGRCLIIDDD
jgi:hypothetical protein